MPWMHPSASRNVRKLLLFISRVSTLVYFEDAQVIVHLCYPVPFPIELVLIRTYNLGRRATADPRLRRRGHWDRLLDVKYRS